MLLPGALRRGLDAVCGLELVNASVITGMSDSHFILILRPAC
jgi:hypothetical protein